MKINSWAKIYIFEFLALLAIYIFSLTDPYFPFWIILGSVIAATLLKKWVSEIIIAGSTLAILLQHYFGVAVKYDSATSIVTSYSSIQLKVLSFIAFLTICYLIKRIFSKLKSSYATSVFLFLIPLLSVLLYKAFNFMLLANLLAVNIWNFFIYYRSVEPLENNNWQIKLKTLLSSIPPVWTRATETRELLDYNLYSSRSADELMNCIQSGCWMIFRGIVTIVILKEIDSAALFYYSELMELSATRFTSLHRIIPLIFSNYESVPAYHLWILIYFSGIKFLFESYYGFLSVSVGIARLLGLNLTSSTNRPWNASNFPDFCGRFMYYYAFILSNYFYLPLQKSLGRMNISTKTRRRVCLFAAITFGGMYFHILKNFSEHLSRDSFLISISSYSLPALYYFSAFAFFCSFIVFERRNSKLRLIKAGYFLFYLGLYSILFSGQFLSPVIGKGHLMGFFLRLFGI